MREIVRALPRPLGFVPTMGALHAGHMRLVEVAREECASVAASIFVNPMQFGAGEDFMKYPRDVTGDGAKFAAAGVDVLFVPEADTMYPPGFSTAVDVGVMGAVFEGALRPGHFAGVATVVTKLLHVVQPDVLYLGQKDAQQTAVLRKAVRELAFAAEVRVVPTVREVDGLALSSRNVYLNARERSAAPDLYRALLSIRDALAIGAKKEDAIAAAHLAEGFELDYFDVVDADTFEPLDTLRAPAFIIGAARLGAARLIDNIWIAA
jgi:pantoate--beta-alanine ligase